MPKQKMEKRAAKIADLQQQITTLKAGRDEIKAIKLKIKAVKTKTKESKARARTATTVR